VTKPSFPTVSAIVVGSAVPLAWTPYLFWSRDPFVAGFGIVFTAFGGPVAIALLTYLRRIISYPLHKKLATGLLLVNILLFLTLGALLLSGVPTLGWPG